MRIQRIFIMPDDFESRISRRLEQLKKGDLRLLERETALKRTSWFDRKSAELDLPEEPSPRVAYELFLLQYLGLDPDDLPVVSESERKIVWLSRNRCEALEACKILGLDTREICRGAYEKSTQAFISRIDPRLRFYRDYREIRPHAQHCREMIVRIDFEHYMELAIGEARKSLGEGNKGYGTVVVIGEEVIGSAHDTVVTEGDPSLHAEVNALRMAVRATGDSDLCGSILLSTCEPCPMCTSLAVLANVTTIVYGASIEETARLGKARIKVPAQEIIDQSPAMVELIGGVLRNECLALYSKM